MNPPPPIPFNPNANSSSDDAFTHRRRVDAAHLPALADHLNARMRNKY
jgi:hypothetical protein